MRHASFMWRQERLQPTHLTWAIQTMIDTCTMGTMINLFRFWMMPGNKTTPSSAEPCPFQGVFNMKSDNLRSKTCLVYGTQLYAVIYSGGGCIDGVFGEPDGL